MAVCLRSIKIITQGKGKTAVLQASFALSKTSGKIRHWE
jgi:hypothetical protein